MVRHSAQSPHPTICHLFDPACLFVLVWPRVLSLHLFSLVCPAADVAAAAAVAVAEQAATAYPAVIIAVAHTCALSLAHLPSIHNTLL